MDKRTVRDIDVKGKRVLVRVDFNVPLGPGGRVLDDRRIRASLPTIKFLLERNAAVILCSHLGRPDGKVVQQLRLAPVAHRLEQLVEQRVQTVSDCVGASVERAARSLKPGEVLLLENLRFHPEEEKNEPQFAKALAALADIYVNDAFGTAHRAHASTAGVAAYLPAVAGLLMEKELTVLGGLLSNPARPFAAVLGGAKISDKIDMMRKLLEKADCFLVGGGMASTFLKARGFPVGESLVEEDHLGTAKSIIEEAESGGVPLLLPIDVVVADRFAADAAWKVVPVKEVPDGWRILDVGPDTVSTFKDALRDCGTIVWNGPLGVIEFKPFAKASEALARHLAKLEATTIIGGGETASLVEQLHLDGAFTHVSTGGGATLEFLSGKTLPGVAVLADKD